MALVVEQNYCSTIQERMTIYRFLQVGFEGPLTIETLKLWKESFSLDFIEVLTEGNPNLYSFFEDLIKGDTSLIEQRERDRFLSTFNLLNPVGKVPAPPWESVYVTKDQTLFGDPVFQIRKQLENFGLQFIDKNKQPEDHIAVELEFMSYLLDFTWKSFMDGDEEEYMKGIYTQYWLHKEHFSHWFIPFTEAIQASETSSFYKGLAELLREFAAEDYEYVKSLKEGLENE